MCQPDLVLETSRLDLVCSRSLRTTKAGKLLKCSELQAPCFMNLVQSQRCGRRQAGVSWRNQANPAESHCRHLQAVDMVQTGEYRDTRGRKVVDVSGFDAFIKSVGFQPNTVAEPRRGRVDACSVRRHAARGTL